MDVALVEHPEDDVDREERRGDQQRLVRERGLEDLRGALEAGLDAGGEPERTHRGFDRGHRVSQRDARRQVEGQRHRRELRLVVHRERGPGGLVSAQRAERHHAALGGGEIDVLKGLGALPEARLDLHHHVILVERAVHDRDLALAEGVVERVVDELRGDAEARCGGPVDHQRRLLPLVLLVTAQIDELRQRAKALRDPRSPRVELPDVVPLERVLVLRVPHAAARADVLHCLEEGGGPRHAGHTSAQSRDHLVGADLPLRERLQHDEHARGVGGGAGPVTLTTRESHHVRDRRVVPDDVDDRGELGLHRLERDVLRRLDDAL